MSTQPLQIGKQRSVVEAYLMGEVSYSACQALQQRLVYEAGGRSDGQIVLLICEHSPAISVGRQGSRMHIRAADHELAGQGLQLHWVNRGGGCIAHGPGQLAVYPIVPLDWYRWSVGEYLRRFQAAIVSVLDRLHCNPITREGRYGVWGRTGQLVAFGAAVKNWVSYHGAFLNVDLAGRWLRLVETEFEARSPMSSLVIERQQRVKISQVRSLLVPALAAAFDCENYHVYSRHPLFLVASNRIKDTRRVG